MPGLIEHIDAIARQRKRDVLYLEFHPQARPAWRAWSYEHDDMRATVLAWLDANEIGWQACGPIANPGSMFPYLGQVYLDVPMDEASSRYRLLRDYLELADGRMRLATVRFYCLALEAANTNAAHDAPGFWERWAENF
ncbi:MAG: hypothetical protein ACXW2U_02500 [Telluria sp.]